MPPATGSGDSEPERSRATVFKRLTDGAWRLVGLAVLVLLFTILLWELRLVVLPVFVALLLCSVLSPLVLRLEGRGWRTLAATWAVFLGFLLLLVAAGFAILPPTIDELDGLSDTVEEGLQDVENWLVTGPLGLDRSQVDDYTDDPIGRLSELAESSSDRIVSGAVLVGEVLAGALLTLVLTFLFLKDGRRFQSWVLEHLPHRRREVVVDASGRAFKALAGYLRGAAILGVVEGTIIGITVWAVGGALAGPVAIFTFLAAFFPIVGAVVAGALATIVVLGSAGFTAALIVLAVVVAVQQLDNDLLVPFIYGQTLQLNPAVILIVLTGGGALGGIVGAFLAVPMTGAAAGAFAAVWERYGEAWRDGPAAES